MVAAHIPTPEKTIAEMFTKLGERLCLDFINTKAHRLYRSPHDLLTGYPALIAWAAYSGIVNDAEQQTLLHEVKTRQDSTVVFEQAIVFREVLHRVFAGIAHADTPNAEDLEQIKKVYIEALAHSRFKLEANHFTFMIDEHAVLPHIVLWAVARSAIDVLTIADLSRIKECPGIDDCGCLFLDVSKNGTRHWCSMDSCGSRAKMRRQYARKRIERVSDTTEQ